MTERGHCTTTAWFSPRVNKGMKGTVLDGPWSKIGLWIPFFLMMLLGQCLVERLQLLDVLPLRTGVVAAAAASTHSSPLPLWPRKWLSGARSNLCRSSPRAGTISAPEAPVASGPGFTEDAWARNLCVSAGADDIERCVRDRKVHIGQYKQDKRTRAKVVGILTQHFQDHLPSEAPLDVREGNYGQSDSVLVASYVKYIEAGGHRVIPIPANASEDHYRGLFLSIDGLLLPGGSAAIHSPEAPYYRATKLFLDWAVQANESGRYFPVLGICLGFQAMIIWAAGDNFTYFMSEDFRNMDHTRKLRILPAAKTSRLFGPERSGTVVSSASTEKDHISVRGGGSHRRPPSNDHTSLEQESLSARIGGVASGIKAEVGQRWQEVEETQKSTPHTFETDAEIAAENLIDKAMLVNLLSNQETAYFHHTHRMTRAEFGSDAALSQRFALLATVVVPRSRQSEEDDSEDEFVAVVESTQYPFYGFQFHPEKSLFEHMPFSSIPHEAYSRWVSNSLALFFANEVGKSTREPTPFSTEWYHIIERYTPTDFSSREGLYVFEEVYFFRSYVESPLVHTTA